MRKIFTFLFAALMSVGMWADNFVPVTDASTLADGDQIIITDVDAAAAISTLQKSNNRGVTTVALTDGVIVPGENVQIITLVAAGNNFMLQVGDDAYLYAASNSSNHLKTANAETVGDNGKFAISITGGVASVTAQGTNSRNDLRYNSGSSCFSCYASSTSVEAGLKIFKKDGGASAETITVTWNSYDLPSSGSSFTKDGVTLTCDIDDDLYGPGTFTTDLGNFTQIVVSGDEACYIDATDGWSGNINQKTWTGNAASVSWGGDIYCYSSDVTFVFTIAPASTPEPAGEVTVVFAANNNTVERTVTLPHNFSCSYENRDGELDAIIKELYEISAGHCHDDNYPVASGNEAVLAGSNGYDNYITISAAFEGTATVSGWYWNSDAYDGDGDWMDYTLTISIGSGTPTAMESIQPSAVSSQKVIRNGMLLIEQNGVIYNVLGARVK